MNKFGLNKTLPKDKSGLVYYADKGRDLKSTKPLLVFYTNMDGEIIFVTGKYVHSQKEWVDNEGFVIYDVIGWVDIEETIKYI